MIQNSSNLRALRDYRSVAENIFCDRLVKWLKEKSQEFEARQLVLNLPSKDREELEDLSHKYGLYPTDTVPIDLAICHSLLYYLQSAKHIRNQQMSLVGQTILEYERVRLNLTEKSAKAINTAVALGITSKSVPPDPKKLDQYDRHLLEAIQRDGASLKEDTQAELRLLQLVLGIADSDVPEAKEVGSDKGVNYIQLWRLLRKHDWQAANEETQKCLIAASGKSTHSPQMIDIDRIPLLDLQTIDSLWYKYSNNRFGFNVQLSILKKINPDLVNLTAQDLEQFGRQVDWIRSSSWIDYRFIDFSSKAVEGHLPVMPLMGWWCWKGGDSSIKSKLEVLLDRVAELGKMQNQV